MDPAIAAAVMRYFDPQAPDYHARSLANNLERITDRSIDELKAELDDAEDADGQAQNHKTSEGARGEATAQEDTNQGEG